MKETHCPLCSCRDLTGSWLKLTYNGKQFDYAECAGCGSLICEPMPDEATLTEMYDLSYCEPEAASPGEFETPDKFSEVLSFLKGVEPGVFIDYGCGEGKLLLDVKALGWRAVGVDFNPEFAAEARDAGIEIRHITEKLGFQADVVHLGDVLEHLTDLDSQFPKIMELVKDGGLIVAHGPLEGNANLFFRFIRFGKKLRGNPVTEMAPFHVILATTEGQKGLFDRSGLEQIEYRISEIAFPAPDKLSLADLRSPRTVGMYAVRKLSQGATSFAGNKTGNRYFYIGRKGGTPPPRSRV